MPSKPTPPAHAASVLTPRLVLSCGPENSRNSEGDLVALPDGRLSLVYSRFDAGRGSDHDHGALAQVTSPDGGLTWPGAPRPLFAREGAANDMSVTLRYLADGRLALFNLRKHSTNDCRLVMRTSSDHGVTWESPVQCLGDQSGYFVVNNDRVLQTRSGRLIVPAAQHAGATGPFDSHGELCFFISDDAGGPKLLPPSWLTA